MAPESWSSLVALFVLSLLLSLALTPPARRLARRFGLVDYPDGRRKLHRGAVPVAGGLVVLATLVLVLGAAALAPGLVRLPLREHADELVRLFLGGMTVCAVGVADDRFHLRGRQKLLGQVLAAGLVIALGVRIDRVQVFGHPFELGPLAVPFTLFWLLGAINALNLLDGMDGLLASLGAILALAMAAMAVVQGQPATAAVAVALAGALAGFLRWNFPPASVFLGDGGSMLIGLAVGVLAIQSSLKGPATVALAAPTALLILPILDTAAAIVRRKLTGRSIYTTDRAHLHHCLVQGGLSHRRSLLVVAVLSLVAGSGALASLALQNEALALLAALAVAGTLVLTRLFGRAELVLLSDRVTAAAASLIARPPGAPPWQAEVRLQGSADWGALWGQVTESAGRLGLLSVRLDVNVPALQEGYNARWDRCPHPHERLGLWRTDVPLLAGGRPVGRLAVTGHPNGHTVPQQMQAVAELVVHIEEAVARLAESSEDGHPGSRANADAADSTAAPASQLVSHLSGESRDPDA